VPLRTIKVLFAPGAHQPPESVANCATIPSFRLQNVFHFQKLGLVVLHDLDEGASGVVGAEDLLVDELIGEVLSEEGGEGGAGDVGGGEVENLSDLFAGIVVGMLGKLEDIVAINGIRKGGRVSIDHSKSKKHEGVAVYLAIACNGSKKIRIMVFKHFAHQLVIVLIDPLVTVCPRLLFEQNDYLIPPISHWCVQAGHFLLTQRTNCLGSERE